MYGLETLGPTLILPDMVGRARDYFPDNRTRAKQVVGEEGGESPVPYRPHKIKCVTKQCCLPQPLILYTRRFVLAKQERETHKPSQHTFKIIITRQRERETERERPGLHVCGRDKESEERDAERERKRGEMENRRLREQGGIESSGFTAIATKQCLVSRAWIGTTFSGTIMLYVRAHSEEIRRKSGVKDNVAKCGKNKLRWAGYAVYILICKVPFAEKQPCDVVLPPPYLTVECFEEASGIDDSNNPAEFCSNTNPLGSVSKSPEIAERKVNPAGRQNMKYPEFILYGMKEKSKCKCWLCSKHICSKVPADCAVGVEVERHQAFWTCHNKPFILALTMGPPHTDSLVVSTKTKAGLITEDDLLPFCVTPCLSEDRRMWQGLQIITDYRAINPSLASSDVSFLNELNNFYARFERGNPTTATRADVSAEHQSLTLSPTEVGAVLSRIKIHKAAGPDGIPGRVLRACSAELAGVLTDIFNLSLACAVVPSCFKTTSIIPIPKNTNPSRLNDYRPVALTPIITKCFERLVLAHLKSCLPPTLDPHQFAYCQNRSTEDAVSIALHSVLSHLDNKNTSVRMLFIDFSSAFNTVIPSQLITKLTDLGISSHMCNCPFLFSLFTHDCKPVNDSNIIIKFADDTTVIGLIKDSDEAAYREEVDRLAEWCDTNNLLLNAEKTKEIIVDFRRNADSHPPLHIKGTAVERVNSFKFLGVHISEDLTWTTSCSKLVKKAHQRLFFLRTLRRNQLSSDILVNFYRCTIESILTNCITAWYGCCSATDRKALQRVVKAAQRITGTPLPAIEDIYRKRYRRFNILILPPYTSSWGPFLLSRQTHFVAMRDRDAISPL
ncbi:hypothetical protein NFI96_010321 [Prochilodus magdalenae]|nr:hypothetical protein NFI96_010321 [Prochilodus magdalenae]